MSTRTIKLTFTFGLAISASACSTSSPTECSDVHNAACTWAGMKNDAGWGTGDGQDRTETWLWNPSDLVFAPDGRAYISDWNSHRIRRVNDDRTIETLVGNETEGDGVAGYGPLEDAESVPLGDPAGAPGPTVSLNHPTQVQFAPDGTAVIAAWHDNKIRTYDPTTGLVKVLAGNSYCTSTTSDSSGCGDGGPAYGAQFNLLKAVAIDSIGQIYVLDQRNERIRMIGVDDQRTIQTVTGNSVNGYEGDGGDASLAEFGFQQGTTPIPDGAIVLHGTDLYISDGLNQRIRKLDLITNQISCIAGIGTAGNSGDGGQALAAQLNDPLDLEFGPDGRLYVADTGNNVIRAIDLDTGIIDRVAGTGAACPSIFDCYEDHEGMDALDVQLASPYGIAFDAPGNLYIADTFNTRIVRIAK